MKTNRRTYKKWSKDEQERLHHLRKRSNKELAQIFNCSPSSIGTARKTYGAFKYDESKRAAKAKARLISKEERIRINEEKKRLKRAEKQEWRAKNLQANQQRRQEAKQQRDSQIVELFKQGVPADQIAVTVGCSVDLVRVTVRPIRTMKPKEATVFVGEYFTWEYFRRTDLMFYSDSTRQIA